MPLIDVDPPEYDFITVESDYIAANSVVWKRYRTLAFYVLERTLDDNPHMAKHHKHSPFLPVGMQLRVPIYPDIIKGTPQPHQLIRWWETVGGKKRGVLIGKA